MIKGDQKGWRTRSAPEESRLTVERSIAGVSLRVKRRRRWGPVIFLCLLPQHASFRSNPSRIERDKSIKLVWWRKKCRCRVRQAAVVRDEESGQSDEFTMPKSKFKKNNAAMPKRCNAEGAECFNNGREEVVGEKEVGWLAGGQEKAN